ncbi:hypothetical protein MYX84_00810 [Acidobacteria bacterium AH-259-O06]|nr:hypothetical protein [Acidobacteria bacterium AH-259-O06]
MTSKKLEKIKKQIAQARQGAGNIHHRKLVSIATKLGRKRDDSKGKEPTFVNEEKGWIPLSIPHHGVLKKGTVHSICDVFDDDVLTWEEELFNLEDK